MTIEEAIKWVERIKEKYIHGGDEGFDNARRKALDMAIEALDERKIEMFDDGTLVVNVKEGAKVGRVLIEGDDHFGGLYYIDDRQKGGWNNIPIGDIKQCSNCGYICTPILADQTQGVYNYCPNCGADMRGG